MKTLFFALTLFSSTLFAQVYVHPQVYNRGNSVQVQIYNNTNANLNCSGPVSMHTRLGRMETGYYFESIYRGSFSSRYFYLSNPRDSISYVSHNIYCRTSP